MMARALQAHGLQADAVFAEAGLDLAAQAGADQRVAAVAMQRVWRRAVELSGDEAFGLGFARQMHPAALQGLGFAWVASDTLRDAFQRLVRYYRMITTAGEVVLEDLGERLRLLYRVPGARGAAAPASLDAALAVFVQMCRFTKDDDFRPARVELQRGAPADRAAFDGFFRCEIEFGAADNALYFDRASLEEPLPMASPELARANDQVIIDYLKRHDAGDIVTRVRAGIIDWLPSGAPSQEEIANSLHTSPRTLQRRLGEHGLTFKELLEAIREELARQYLSMPGRSVSEVAYLLGYSEPGNFTRSFKRWTGLTPQQYQSGP